jgi:hypothetical protein
MTTPVGHQSLRSIKSRQWRIPYREHPAKGWQSWNTARAAWGFDPILPWPCDPIVSWEDTWCEPEED